MQLGREEGGPGQKTKPFYLTSPFSSAGRCPAAWTTVGASASHRVGRQSSWKPLVPRDSMALGFAKRLATYFGARLSFVSSILCRLESESPQQPWDLWTGHGRTHFGHVWVVLFTDHQEPLKAAFEQLCVWTESWMLLPTAFERGGFCSPSPGLQ